MSQKPKNNVELQEKIELIEEDSEPNKDHFSELYVRKVGGAVANYAAKTATDEFLEDVVEKGADKIMDSMNTSLIEAIYKFQVSF
jgi:aconitase B